MAHLPDKAYCAGRAVSLRDITFNIFIFLIILLNVQFYNMFLQSFSIGTVFVSSQSVSGKRAKMDTPVSTLSLTIEFI